MKTTKTFTISFDQHQKPMANFIILLFALSSILITKATAIEPEAALTKDWPFFLGPTADSKSTEQGLITPWPKTGPTILWQRPVHECYAIGSVQAGRFYQPDYENKKVILDCLDAGTGKPIWRFERRSDYQDLYEYNSGPRCSPVLDGDRVYLYGVDGILYCIHTETGKEIWHKNLNADFSVVQNFFGVGSTPVIFNELILVMVGGSPAEDSIVTPGRLDRVTPNGAGIVGLKKDTGKLVYKTIDGLASYSSLKITNHAGRPWCFAFMREGLFAFDPRNGKIDSQFPWRARILESVNASNPVVVENEVFISETYGPGSALLKFGSGGFEEVWKDSERSRQKAMQTHWNTAIHHDGYLYGSSGRHSYNAELRCVEWKTGKVMWSIPNLTRSSLLYIDGHFICLSEDGSLRLIRANPKEYELVSEVVYRDPADVKVTPANDATTRLLKYPAWAAPIVANGRMYVRGKGRLVCAEILQNQALQHQN